MHLFVETTSSSISVQFDVSTSPVFVTTIDTTSLDGKSTLSSVATTINTTSTVAKSTSQSNVCDLFSRFLPF